MKSIGPSALGQQIGDYNMLYQCLILIMTYIPIKPLYVYKITSIIFDYLLAFSMIKLIGLIIKDSKHIKVYKLIIFTITLFSPLVILNSAMWAQCDVIYVYFIIQSLVFFIDDKRKDRYPLAFIMLGIAFALKLQAIFILPFYLYVWYRDRDFSLSQFLFIPITMLITAIPNVIYGRSPFDVFLNYINQTGTYTKIAMNYPSFWTIFLDVENEAYQNPIKYIGVIVAILVLGIIMLYWMYKKVKFTPSNMIHMAFVFAFTCVLFLPRMHDRYGYIYEILAIVLYIINSRTRQLMIVLFFVNLIAYWNFLMGFNYDYVILSIVNFIVWLLYVYVSTKTILKDLNVQNLEPKKELENLVNLEKMRENL